MQLDCTPRWPFIYTDNSASIICRVSNVIMNYCPNSYNSKPNDKLNWACRVRDILCIYGFHNIWISQYVNHVAFFICEFKQRMNDTCISEMNTFFNESPKCHLYRYIFDNMFYNFILIVHLIIFISHIFIKCVYQHIILILKLEDSIIYISWKSV